MQKDNYNRGGYIAFLFSMIFSVAFFIYVTVVHPGVDLKEIPEQPASGAEQTLAGGTAAVDVSKIEKPWEENADLAAHGSKVYAQNCAVCHGDKGAGDGAAGQALNPKPRDFVAGAWKYGGDSVGLFKTISNGVAGTSMAAFAHLPFADRWALVQHVRALTKNKVNDDPAKVEAFAKTAK